MLTFFCSPETSPGLQELLKININTQASNSALKPAGYRLFKPANLKMFHFLFQSRKETASNPETHTVLTPPNQGSKIWECSRSPSTWNKS